MKSTMDHAIAVGWNAEAFARTKNIKGLSHYLTPSPSPEGQREKGARDVRMMFERMIKKQEAASGTE